MATFYNHILISNVVSCTSLSLAWIAYVRKYHVSPLSDWQPFLAFYSALFVFQQVSRPLRLSIAAATSPFTDWFNAQLAAKLGLQRPLAWGVMFAVQSALLIAGIGFAIGVYGRV